MTRTIQCPECGVVLNVPESAAGRKLKCPQCAAKFQAPAADPGASALAGPAFGHGPASTMFPTRGPGASSSGSVELPASRGGGDFDLPTSPGPLRDTLGTFELPLLEDDAPRKPGASTRPAAASDALALFDDEPKSARRPKAGAEARSRPRRCPTCGNVVGVGMSLCSTCGLDLDTGQRIAPIDLADDAMPEVYHPPTPPMGLLIVGTVCSIGYTILALASLVSWSKGASGMQFLLVVWGFGLYASAQFLRRKSLRPMFVALGLTVGVGLVTLIALPIYQANVEPDVVVNPGQNVFPIGAHLPIDADGPDIRPITDRLDMNKITWGIASLLAYAALSVYLNSPGLRRHFRK